MASGLLALLDDVAVIAKIAAASIDDAAALAAKAGTKAAGIVIDDAAVTPKYVVGFAADRELPIIVRIAKGSLKSKLLVLLPGALAISAFAPWVLDPLLLAGGTYLSLEGFHKVADLVRPAHAAHSDADSKDLDDDGLPAAASTLEDERVASALRTDLILSAEVMAISLNEVSSASLPVQAVVLAVVGAAVTIAVYGAVALIVKADDAGVALAKNSNGAVAAVGRFIVFAMPGFLSALSLGGMVAMLWVGGGIVIHALHGVGVHAPDAILQRVTSWAAQVPVVGGVTAWLAGAALSAVVGVALGAVAAGVVAVGKKLIGVLKRRRS
ncbi:MAG TPA: DUF808 family protein [Myxococcota bacterium]